MTNDEARRALEERRQELLPVRPGCCVPVVEKPADTHAVTFESEPKKVCVWCGETLDEHEDDYPGRPIPKMPCLGLKSGFVPRV